MNLTKLYCQQMNEPYLEWQQELLSVVIAWGKRIQQSPLTPGKGVATHNLITGCNPKSDCNLIRNSHAFSSLLNESFHITGRRILTCSVFQFQIVICNRCYLTQTLQCYNHTDLGPGTHLSLKKSPSFREMFHLTCMLDSCQYKDRTLPMSLHFGTL